jgi:hypothetical protein
VLAFLDRIDARGSDVERGPGSRPRSFYPVSVRTPADTSRPRQSRRFVGARVWPAAASPLRDYSPPGVPPSFTARAAKLTDRGRNLARDSPTSAGRASVVEEGQIELVNALGVGDRVDLDDLPATDREAEYHKEPSTRSHHDSHRSVDERRSCSPGTPLDHGWRTTDPPRCARRRGTAVCSEHYLRVEHRNKRVEVSGARGSKEGADDLPMVSRVDRAMFGYFESKREAERVMADSGLPWTPASGSNRSRPTR